jgi:LysM repeat protein
MKKGLTALLIGALLVVLIGQTAWAAPPACTCGCTGTRIVHIVRWGENLWRISRWYGTTVEAIAYANGIANPHCIYAGQRLIIPCGNICPTGCHGPCQNCQTPCKDCEAPCKDCEDSSEECEECETPCKECTAPDPKPKDCGQVHIVGCGDTLSGISWRYGVSINCLVRANGIVNPHRIYKGQKIVIPCDCTCGTCRPPGKPPRPPHQGFTYIVRCGDTLSGIAWRYGVNMWSIVHANGIANPNCIYAGQRLYIP